ncbi:MAG: hypothetical protein FWC82_02905, partial [Firmicutes bacterium]|nr:hypothetical protein [Bacillota bacterium]
MINLFGYANGNGNGLGWLDIPPVVWLVISIAIIVAAFAAAAVLMYLQGDIAKFKNAAVIVIKSPTMAGADKSSEKMPKKVLQLYKRMKRTGQAPVEVIDVMSCVLAPYPKTAASKLVLVTFFASMFALIMMIGAALIYPLAMPSGIFIVAIVGIVFTIVAVILQIFYYKGTLKVYDDYITALSKVMKGSSPGQPQFNPATSEEVGLGQVGGIHGTAIDFGTEPSNAEPFIPQTMDRPSDNAINSIKREQEEMEREVKAAKEAQRAAAQAAAANMGIILEPEVPIFG